MNSAQRRQALLDVFDKHEDMMTLLNCIGRSPSVYDDQEENDGVQDSLIERGLLAVDGGYCQTTAEGRMALIDYINGR